MPCKRSDHQTEHAFTHFNALDREGLQVVSRRNMLKAGLAGIAGLTVPSLLQARAEAAKAGKPISSNKSVILLWMTGGPSHIDTWDMKPDQPERIRGSFKPINTKIPGVQICEHLPKMAAMLDKFTIIRSVDARTSNHEPNMVFQTGHREAAPRANRDGRKYPAIASVCAKFRGPNQPGMPPSVVFRRSNSHIAFGGYLGRQYDPFIGNRAAFLPRYDSVGNDTGKLTGGDLFSLPAGLTAARIRRRRSLRQSVDQVRARLDRTAVMDSLDAMEQQAVELVVGKSAREAFDVEREPTTVRERYGKHLWHQQALLARRLVERGVSFVTLDLSYHTASGTWDTHGDDVPPYGGINSGLKPILPIFDHLITTLVSDLDERGMLDDTLVIAMGEFGRTPQITDHDGRNHWAVVLSMAMAGGGLRHGQVIGSTEPDGSYIASRPVTPGDLAATIYQHMEVPLDATFLDHKGQPIHIVREDGRPLPELF